ncbi:hypothetical protein N8T08_001801 [Aspergillus melleus]|uniref:Uncharacterized protein n=1 Tax=Aspergillus melleus TaxID=138277 RepID=A0ACC3B9I4_9EURO|nr:hypothetical protein N8T08_001801 [Aspergillus melleus]
MSNGWFQTDQLQITQGQESIKIYEDKSTASGHILKRSFCGTCGSRFFAQSAMPEMAQFVAVASGTMDNRANLHPSTEAWTRSRHPWLLPVEGAEQREMY